MTAVQRQLALALLKSGLSEKGFGKATNIISLELILQDLEGASRRFPRTAASSTVPIAAMTASFAFSLTKILAN